MGSSFANVQVLVRGRDSGTLRSAVVESLRAALASDGFVPVKEGEAVERTILIADDANWISIYDEVCDEQHQEELERLAMALSSRTGAHAMTVLVHASSVLELQWFDAGQRVDRFNSAPSYFEKVGAEEKKAARGRPSAWVPLLAPGRASKSLSSAWRAKKLFAEDTLRETATAFGLDADRATLGFRYASEAGETGMYLELCFRRSSRPAEQVPAEGPPRFEYVGSSGPPSGAVRGPLRFHCWVRSRGGPSRGVSVAVTGPAIEQQLLLPISVRLSVSHRGGSAVSEAPLVQRGEGTFWVAAFPEQPIAAGRLAPQAVEVGAAAVESSARQQYDLIAAWEEDEKSLMQVYALVSAIGVKPGSASVQLVVVPHAAHEGQAGVALDLSVFPAARRPLRAPTSAPNILDRPRHVLFALVSFDCPQSEAAPVAARLIERFAEVFQASGQLSVTVFAADAEERPRTTASESSVFFRGARWKRVRGELERARRVVGQIKTEPADFFARRPSDGFSFGGALAAPLSAEDPELPSLALWCDLENVSAERASAIQALAEELICEAMFQHAGIQALCGRATTDLVSHLDQTEYERNCDIHGPATLRRSWLSRFVRGVEVGCLWLGRQLVARVPDLEALHHAARVRAVAESLEVRIENEAALDAVEQALAPLLPSASDAQAASNRLYGC
ncbi:MAG: hypothetical protein ABUL62_29900 [Myxococcales bacterium]